MKLVLIVVSVLCFIGVFTLPYGYYTFLRIAVFLASAAVVYKEYQGDITPQVILFSIIGIFFNPIIRVYLHDKNIWAIIDFIVGLIFLFKAMSYKDNTKY